MMTVLGLKARRRQRPRTSGINHYILMLQTPRMGTERKTAGICRVLQRVKGEDPGMEG